MFDRQEAASRTLWRDQLRKKAKDVTMPLMLCARGTWPLCELAPDWTITSRNILQSLHLHPLSKPATLSLFSLFFVNLVYGPRHKNTSHLNKKFTIDTLLKQMLMKNRKLLIQNTSTKSRIPRWCWQSRWFWWIRTMNCCIRQIKSRVIRRDIHSNH